ncbi:MAG TPA: glutamate synthase large subunit [Acidimicrobiales bacterium]|nr:glutamate synthase large subunit [Acidimicrobiales bacterium]
MRSTPGPTGLYQPGFEHDACGVALVVDMHGRRSHGLVERGLQALCNLEHRGATGSDVNTGDGAGILIQMPDAFLRAVAGVDLPPAGSYGAGMAFLPRTGAEDAVRSVEKVVEGEGLVVLGWREVPFDDSMIGPTARSVEPLFRQMLVGAGEGPATTDLERRVFILRKRLEQEVPEVYFPSLSTRTLVYKGMLTAPQLLPFFPDLTDPRLDSALALVHSRFSTNTFPSWPLAHPYRFIAHNGEINTIEGNRNWMRAREALLASPLLPDIERIFPVCTPGDPSDSASFDEVLELLHMGGRSLPHAVLMMVPEAWENHPTMDPARRAFYRYHSSLMEPWDGPAAVAFTDGTVIGAVLDRNGLRPLRYWVSAEGLVVMASEAGVLDIPADQVVQKGRLQPGRMFLVDTSKGRIIDDDEIKAELAAEHPYQEWLDAGIVHMDDLPPRTMLTPQHASVVQRQRSFGYTEEELRVLVAPMARTGAEPIGSMGTDTPIAILSERPRVLFDYFSQLFAQVTNPPLDAIREELVTSLSATVGPERNLLEPTADSCRQITLPFPVIDNEALAKLRYINEHGETPGFRAVAIDGLYPVADGGEGLRRALEQVRTAVSVAIEDGANIIILSDRFGSADMAPIPSLLLTSAVHHHLIREKSRTRVGLIVEAGDAREVHHIALLIGYGAAAVNPYLAFESVEDMIANGVITGVNLRDARYNTTKALGKGVLKVMSKRGISTVASYTGAQVFEAIGLGRQLVAEYFAGTVSRLDGVGLDELAAEVASRHRLAWPDRPEELAHRPLDDGGEYQWRREGEYHLFNPETVYRLQHSTRSRRYEIFKEYTRLVDDQSARLATLRGMFRFKDGARPPVPIEEVEPVSSIVKRFSTGAMSYGSISAEAHETLAVAMNRLGARSNTGEGGEDSDRFTPDPNGDLRRSAIKQVASGRFGVTSEYLVNADDLQIKIAQGAKPGEGGQLPGNKIYPWIAKTRHSTPGVGLISPPPHHDIYSIEDIKQLIHDLKCSNPRARIHVKLVAEVGVGTVAAGVCKAHADVVLISGHDGGTGASPLTSLKHAGAPWEMGLAETQQTLLLNGLRDRIVVQVDGQMKTGRDVVIGALLGAEEFGFATAPLVVSGCVMMRVCHLDTCPVGVATQNPELRKRFSGKPEFVVTFFEYIAEEVRELLAALGFRTLEEAIGRVDLLDTVEAVNHWKAAGLDLSPILAVPDVPADAPRHQVHPQDHGLENKLDNFLITEAAPALENGTPVVIRTPVRNVDRTVGTLLGHQVTLRYGGAGLPDDSITVHLTGSAGQSFGAFLPRGITLRLEGDANDYLGKGLSGGHLVLRPPLDSPFAAEENVVAGNVILYGATGGDVFIRGLVGERFCVRNSGASAVVEGVGDHGCEYMTGGRVVVLGPTGRNFAAGMSGGIAYVHDPRGTFPDRLNREFVDIEPLDEEDLGLLADLIGRHRVETDSAVAARLLADWDTAVAQFVKVMPRDYKRVMTTLKLAEAEGRPAEEAVMEMMGAPRG